MCVTVIYDNASLDSLLYGYCPEGGVRGAAFRVLCKISFLQIGSKALNLFEW